MERKLKERWLYIGKLVDKKVSYRKKRNKSLWTKKNNWIKELRMDFKNGRCTKKN
jgi:hypothetical protein